MLGFAREGLMRIRLGGEGDEAEEDWSTRTWFGVRSDTSRRVSKTMGGTEAEAGEGEGEDEKGTEGEGEGPPEAERRVETDRQVLSSSRWIGESGSSRLNCGRAGLRQGQLLLGVEEGQNRKDRLHQRTHLFTLPLPFFLPSALPTPVELARRDTPPPGNRPAATVETDEVDPVAADDEGSDSTG